MSSTYHFPKKTVRDVPVHGKRVLVRADYNVPLGKNGEIESDFRILQSLPTLEYLLKNNCTVFVVAHLGRPDGEVNKKYTLEPVFRRLKELLPQVTINFVTSTTDDKARQACKAAQPGSLTLLENLRYNPGEETNSSDFAEALKTTTKPDYFVQDGFGVVHRAHASTEAITHIIPSVAGLLLETEVTVLQTAMKTPKHPLVAVVGGAKISDKIGFIEQLLPLADTVLIGGAMANTFLKYQNHPIGKSIFEEGQEAEIERIFSLAKPGQVILPIDVATATKIDATASRKECSIDEVSGGDYILDIGSQTMHLFDQKLATANTVIWNGTLGFAELPDFAAGSADLAMNMSHQHHSVVSVIGGGDTAEFALDWLQENPEATFTHISTGGGASLELMSGLKLPGVEALLNHR